MLKAQLRSKVSALGPRWQDIEDILTGDFFGALDYLPRRPFLGSFIRWVARFNDSIRPPDLGEVAWDLVDFLFWPMLHAKDSVAEPDLVIVSDRWVLVVEVKLDSGLGSDQPWREYCIGEEIARDRGLPADSVYYLIVARSRLDVAATFPPRKARERQRLLARTFQLRWSQAAALIERWLSEGAGGQELSADQTRMLGDLLAAMRRRRSIVFGGFEFVNQRFTAAFRGRLFCPDRFRGFLSPANEVAAQAASHIFLSRFDGFLGDARRSDATQVFHLAGSRFDGFQKRAQAVDAPYDQFFLRQSFGGFLEACPSSRAAATLEIET